MTLPTSLERIADALERIADALAPQDAQEALDDINRQPTLTNPLLTWFASTMEAVEPVEDASEAQTPLEHCGQCYQFPGCDMTLSSCHAHPKAKETSQTTWEWLGVVGRPAGKPSHCGRCGREGTRRMNNSNHCRQCRHEAWWDE